MGHLEQHIGPQSTRVRLHIYTYSINLLVLFNVWSNYIYKLCQADARANRLHAHAFISFTIFLLCVALFASFILCVPAICACFFVRFSTLLRFWRMSFRLSSPDECMCTAWMESTWSNRCFWELFFIQWIFDLFIFKRPSRCYAPGIRVIIEAESRMYV